MQLSLEHKNSLSGSLIAFNITLKLFCCFWYWSTSIVIWSLFLKCQVSSCTCYATASRSLSVLKLGPGVNVFNVSQTFPGEKIEGLFVELSDRWLLKYIVFNWFVKDRPGSQRTLNVSTFEGPNVQLIL